MKVSMPARSRANRYRLIDRLIEDGLLENTRGAHAAAYALRITDKGVAVLAGVAAMRV